MPFSLASFRVIGGYRSVLRKVYREIDRGNHAVGSRDSFSGNFKCGAVISTGARKRKTQRDIHAFVKCVKL